MELDVDSFHNYTKAMDQIDAAESMDALVKADWPSYKESGRSKIMNSLKLRASPRNPDGKKEYLTNEDIAKMLLGR